MENILIFEIKINNILRYKILYLHIQDNVSKHSNNLKDVKIFHKF